MSILEMVFLTIPDKSIRLRIIFGGIVAGTTRPGMTPT
jgi:hypothetical protein